MMSLLWGFLIIIAFTLGILLGRWSVLDHQRREREEEIRLLGHCYSVTPVPGEDYRQYLTRITESIRSNWLH